MGWYPTRALSIAASVFSASFCFTAISSDSFLLACREEGGVGGLGGTGLELEESACQRFKKIGISRLIIIRVKRGWGGIFQKCEDVSVKCFFCGFTKGCLADISPPPCPPLPAQPA